MQLNIIDSKKEVKSVAIITPTIGSTHLLECMQSVEAQTFKDIKHVIVIDGPQVHDDNLIYDTLMRVKSNWSQTVLPENVGKFEGNWYGHRVYAAFPYLVNADAVIFLDEDNWIEPDHVESLVNVINERQVDWSFSFRKIYDKDGTYLCDDNCESLGIHPVFHNNQVHHIDTSAYCVRRDVATRVAGAFYGQWGADRQYFAMLSQHFPDAYPSQRHSLCYRLDGNANSVTKEFFENGNNEMAKRYPEGFPWLLTGDPI